MSILERKGLVERVPGQRPLFCLTPAGVRLADKLLEDAAAQEKGCLADNQGAGSAQVSAGNAPMSAVNYIKDVVSLPVEVPSSTPFLPPPSERIVLDLTASPCLPARPLAPPTVLDLTCPDSEGQPPSSPSACSLASATSAFSFFYVSEADEEVVSRQDAQITVFEGTSSKLLYVLDESFLHDDESFFYRGQLRAAILSDTIRVAAAAVCSLRYPRC